MTDLTVAKTIAQQMGGSHRLAMMIGAYNFVGDDKSLMFAFKGSTKANRCKVTLDFGSDTYKLELFKIGRAPAYTVKTTYESDDVYWDDLSRLFERNTGLRLSL